MTGAQILSAIIEILVGGITGIAEGIGTGLQSLVKNSLFDLSEAGAITGLSTFGIVVCVFAGIGLAVGLSKLIIHWVSSLGGSRV